MEDLSYSIEITTSIGCKNLCAYCPQDSLIRSYPSRASRPEMRTLSADVFARCLEHLPSGCRIYFSGFAEPWQHPRCTDLVELASRLGFRVFIFSTAVGMSLDDVERLSRIELAAPPTIHLPDDSHYTRIAVTDAYLDVLVELGRAFPDATYVCPTFEGERANVHLRLQRWFPNGSDPRRSVHFDKAVGRASQVSDRRVSPAIRHFGRLGLCFRVAGPVLLPSGDLVLCCADYSMQHVLGNLLQDDLHTILMGTEYAQVLRALAQEDGAVLCRQCEYATPLESSDHGVRERLVKLFFDRPELLTLLP
ncbi:MAG TPA: SPASM domain-containing protein [Polyangiaceae bacterium]